LSRAIENQIDDENLMAICLGINDDIIKLFKRYDEVKSNKMPTPFLSSFHSDYMTSNLNYKNSTSVSPSIEDNKKENLLPDKQNLLDFGLSNYNSNKNKVNNMNISNDIQDFNKYTNERGKKINDINDIFDAFK
jgi:hypothetical protein